jgi:D-3-phosphoglycerate dehydrogenase / 2-oxoglutarate reductase
MQPSIKRVLITDPIDPQFVETLRKLGLEVNEKKLSKEELLKEIGDYDCLVVRSGTQVTADVIAAGKKLKLIGRAGTGVDNIDVPAATKHGVLVMNTPGTLEVKIEDFRTSLIDCNVRLID